MCLEKSKAMVENSTSLKKLHFPYILVPCQASFRCVMCLSRTHGLSGGGLASRSLDSCFKPTENASSHRQMVRAHPQVPWRDLACLQRFPLSPVIADGGRTREHTRGAPHAVTFHALSKEGGSK